MGDRQIWSKLLQIMTTKQTPFNQSLYSGRDESSENDRACYWHELLVLIASGKVKVADLAEFNPTFDIDGISAKVAARLLAGISNQHLLQE